jgi:hypothetical protein
MKRALLIAAALVSLAAVHATAQAQNVTLQAGVPPALEVQRLAPQLVLFAGGEVNFANLVNGLAFGVPVTLTTPLQTGLTEVVSFTPAGTMTPLAIAQTLESARQSLISRGIAIPTAQQLGIALAGGTIATATGTTQVQPLITTAATVSTATPSTSASLLQSGTLRNTSDSPLPRGISDTPAAFSGTSLTPPAAFTTATPSATAPFGPGTTTTTTTGTGTTPAAAGGTRPFR